MPENTNLNNKHVTILLSGGLLAPSLWEAVNDVARRYNLRYYLTTLQNLRLLGAGEQNIEAIKKELTGLGLTLKAPGLFPRPKVCVGAPFCNLGQADTFALADRLLESFGERANVKPKYKISISGCPASCAGALLVDIGIVATRKGFDLYAGGKGGALPKVARKIATGLSGDQAVEAVGRLADYHAAKTPKKLRLYKLLDEPDFPFTLKSGQNE